jgi:hypothetical protein
MYKPEDDDEVADGGSVRVPLFLSDSARPLLTADAATRMRIAARDQYIARTSDAWRHLRSVDAHEPSIFSPPDVTSSKKPDDEEAMRETAYEQYKQNLSNAWRSPVGRTNPNAATAIERERQREKAGR